MALRRGNCQEQSAELAPHRAAPGRPAPASRVAPRVSLASVRPLLRRADISMAVPQMTAVDPASVELRASLQTKAELGSKQLIQAGSINCLSLIPTKQPKREIEDPFSNGENQKRHEDDDCRNGEKGNRRKRNCDDLDDL